MKPNKAILTKINTIIKDGKFVDEVCKFEVRVMAIAEGYAMVRRKGALPFVCDIRNLTTVDKEAK